MKTTKPSRSITLTERTMLVSLSMCAWSARKFDRKVTDETLDANDAEAGAGRFNKLLVSKDALKEIQRIIDATRNEHHTRTLPWRDDSARIMTTRSYEDYTARMRERRIQFEEAVENFLKRYPKEIKAAKDRLGDMFDAGDYPPVDAIRARFEFDLEFGPVPVGNDFRAKISDAQAEAIARDIERRLEDRMNAAIRDVYSRIADVTEKMAKKLKAYEPGTEKTRATGSFHTTLVSNIADLVNLIPVLNITEDAGLTKLGEQMRADLTAFDAETLKADPKKRKDTAAKADAILKRVNGFLA